MATTRKTTAVATPRRTTLLLATRKGLWMLASDPTRRAWKLSGPHFLGHIVHHAVTDPRDGKTTLAAARTGHLGPTVFRSPLTEWMFGEDEKAQIVRKGFLARVPKGRLGEPDDLAGPLLFLASKASDFYTGHILYADGGYTAG